MNNLFPHSWFALKIYSLKCAFVHFTLRTRKTEYILIQKLLNGQYYIVVISETPNSARLILLSFLQFLAPCDPSLPRHMR
jgi:hypothetical protein